MRPRSFVSTLAGLLGLLAPAVLVAADGHAPGCPHGRACQHGHACCAAHGHGGNPCARFLRYDCLPLPPIAFSRYAENGDYDCARAVFGDGRPKHSWAEDCWYGYRQPYPLPHAVLRDSTRPELLNAGPPRPRASSGL